MGSIRVAVLGTAEVVVDGELREISAAKHRALLSVLALHVGQRVSVDTIVDTLWGDAAPPGASSTLQGYVADLRRLLEPRRGPREPGRVLVTVSSGYALRLPSEDLDLTRFEDCIRRAARSLETFDPASAPSTEPSCREELSALLAELDTTLGDWRGEPLSDLGSGPDIVAERDRLKAMLIDGQLLRASAALGLGLHAQVAVDLEAPARANPWNERLWGVWAIALAGSGRQAEALSCLRELAGSLREELGIDPTPDIRKLEAAILRQEIVSPQLEPMAARTTPDVSSEAWPLVGRDTEIAQLVRVVDQVRGGRLTAVHVTGEHGIGKSRLTRELEGIAVRQGFRVARVQCRPDTRRTPLWAWSRLVRDLSGDPATDTAEPWDAASRLLEEIADEPTLLVLDDAHWSDDFTLRALDHLLRDEPRAPLLLTIAQRLHPLPRSYAMSSLLATLARVHAEHLALAGLSPEATGKLLGSVCGARTHPRVAEGACERMDGNPFLLIELARHGELAPASLPPSIRAVLTHHLARVPERTLDLLKPASLLTRTWDADFLAMAADVDVEHVLTVMTAAVASGILVEEHDDRYTFAHQVVRELLASGLSRPARARWHAAFATVLEERTPLDRPDRRGEMDRHWRAAGYPFARRAWQAQLAAARRAGDDGLADEADRLLEHAAASIAMDREATDAERHLLSELRRPVGSERGHSRRADPVRSA